MSPYTKTVWTANVTPVTAASMNNIEAGIANAPGTEIGYNQITASVTVSSSTEGAGTVVIPGSSYVFDGAPVIAEFYSAYFQPASANGALIIACLFEGSTEITRLADFQTALAGSNWACPAYARMRFTPSAGSHTYSVTAFCINGTPGLVGAGVGGASSPPAYLRFIKV